MQVKDLRIIMIYLYFLTELIAFLGSLTYFIGFNFFEKPQRSPRRDFFYIVLASGFFLVFYSIFIEFDGLGKLFQTTMMLSIGFQGLIRLIFFLLDPIPQIEMRELIKKFYIENESCLEKRSELQKCLKLIVGITKFIFFLYITCMFGPLVFSLFDKIFNGTTSLPFPLSIPGLNRNTAVGFTLNYLIQVYLSCIIITGYIEVDSQFVLYVSQMMVFVNMLKFKLNELSRIMSLNETKKSEPRHVRKKVHQEKQKTIKVKLKEIFEYHNEIKNYNTWLKLQLNKVSLVLVVMNTYIFVSCGIAMMTSDYYAAMGYAIQSLFLLLIFCGMGEFLGHQHNRMLDIMWEFEWYEMSITQQKDWLNFMVNAQQRFDLEPLFIGIMNLELYIKVSIKTRLFKYN